MLAADMLQPMNAMDMLSKFPIVSFHITYSVMSEICNRFYTLS